MTGFGFSSAPTGAIAFSTLIIVLVIGGFIYVIAQGIMTHAKNSSSPVLEADAVVVGRREEVSGFDHTRTSYYATFQFENGDRLELGLKGTEYGMLAQGDRGKLTYQGTRYLGFVRR